MDRRSFTSGAFTFGSATLLNLGLVPAIASADSQRHNQDDPSDSIKKSDDIKSNNLSTDSNHSKTSRVPENVEFGDIPPQWVREQVGRLKDVCKKLLTEKEWTQLDGVLAKLSGPDQRLIKLVDILAKATKAEIIIRNK